MSSPKTTRTPRRVIAPILREWRVTTAHGSDQKVKAHECDVFSGVLAFSTAFDHEDDYVIVRAFAPNAWHDVNLVDTEVAAVHLPPPPHLVVPPA